MENEFIQKQNSFNNNQLTDIEHLSLISAKKKIDVSSVQLNWSKTPYVSNLSCIIHMSSHAKVSF